MYVAEIETELKGMRALNPSQSVGVAGGSGFAPLPIRNQVRTAETRKRIQVVIATVSKGVQRADTVQNVESQAAEVPVDLVPPENEVVNQSRSKRGSQIGGQALIDRL